MLPANDNVTTARVMTVVTEMAAAILEFNPDAFPFIAAGIHPALGFTIRITNPDRFNHKTEFKTDHAEEEHDSLFVNRGMLQSSEVQKRPICNADSSE